MKKLLLFSLVFLSTSAFAEVWLPRIFSDNMLLQRDTPVKIWGKAKADANVEVHFTGQSKKTKANSNGEWIIILDKMSANKNPTEMLIFENGKEAKKIRNILVGEVWLLGGQSNMEWPLLFTSDFKKFSKRANYQNLRYFNQQSSKINLSNIPAEDSPEGANWSDLTNARKAEWFSGLGLYFGELLMKDLDVPVGLVFSALGASKMISWIPEEKIDTLPYWKSEWDKFRKGMKSYDYKTAHKKWVDNMVVWEKAKKEGRKTPKPKKPYEFTNLQQPNATPVYWYNGFVAPIAGFTVKGALWYQGESDSGKESLNLFQEQLGTVIKTWREKFENPNMPFIIVQLASFADKRDWALVRWSQYQVAKKTKNCYCVNIVDCGEEKQIHPKDKTTVAERIEKTTLAEIYKTTKVKPYGPIFSGVKFMPKYAEVSFDLFGSNLVGKGEPRGFELKIDGNWKPAQSKIFGNKVKVTPIKHNGEKIEGVRYLWSSWAKPNVWLYNSNDIPALSFTYENSKK